MPFEKGYNLECASPEDTEYFLNACKRGEVVEVTQCRYKDPFNFLCKDVLDKYMETPMKEMDGYFCMTPQHRERVISRCKNQ